MSAMPRRVRWRPTPWSSCSGARSSLPPPATRARHETSLPSPSMPIPPGATLCGTSPRPAWWVRIRPSWTVSSRSEPLLASLRVDPRQARLAIDEEVPKPLVDQPQVIHPAEGCAGTRELMRFVGDAHEPNGPAQGTQHREELLRLGDGAPQIVL